VAESTSNNASALPTARSPDYGPCLRLNTSTDDQPDTSFADDGWTIEKVDTQTEDSLGTFITLHILQLGDVVRSTQIWSADDGGRLWSEDLCLVSLRLAFELVFMNVRVTVCPSVSQPRLYMQ